jgi:hypothetical protein
LNFEPTFELVTKFPLFGELQEGFLNKKANKTKMKCT